MPSWALERWLRRHGSLLLAMLAVAAIADALVDIGLRLSAQSPRQDLQSVHARQRSSTADEPLENWHLMGLSQVQPKAPQGGETHLPLHLQGLFMGKDTQSSGALLLLPGQSKAQLLHVGDALGGGASIVAVHEQYLVLRRSDGQIETLHLHQGQPMLRPEQGPPNNSQAESIP